MKKLFTFAAAVLASFSLWAVDYYAPTADELIILTDGTNLVNHAAVTNAVNTFTITKDKYCADPEDVSKLTDKVPCLDLKDGNTKKTLTMAIAGCDSITLYHDKNAKARHIKAVLTPEGGAAATLEGPASTTYTGFQLDANTSYSIIFTGLEGTSGGDINVYAVRLHKGVTCEDPEAHLTFNKSTAYVGDPFSYNYSSKNGGALNDSYTLNGAPAVQGTDYTFSSGNLTVLKAGQFVMHRTVDAQDGYCAVDVSDTIQINEKTPVTSFEIDAPATARIGEEVTIELKNFDAAPTEIHWYDEEFTEITAANGKTSYTFTPDAAGNYTFQITAWNDFNKLNEEAYNYIIIGVVVVDDASLSDLKVNGTTLGDFAADKYEYAIGEFGVYEAINVTATANDAPYATAEVVDDKAGTITVTVTADDKTTKNEYVLTYTRGAKTELVAVSDSLTWDWAKAGSKTAALDGTTLPTNSQEFNFADVLSGQDASFKAESLIGRGQNANGGGYAQVHLLKFHADKNGSIIVEFSNTGSTDRPDRVLLVNDVQTAYKSKTSASHETTDKISVAAGDVVIEALEMKETPAKNMIRVYSLTYVPNKGETAIDNIEAGQVVKTIENGQLVIIKNGVRYNAQGSIVR